MTDTRVHGANRLSLSVSESYERWIECRRKVAYPTRDAAEHAAFALRTAESTPVLYGCRWCGGIHLGREPRRRTEQRNPPSHKQIRGRPDVATLLAIGPRAYWCGHIESVGSERKRLGIVTKRLAVAQRKERRGAGG